MGEKLVLRRHRVPYEPDTVTEDQVDAINQMMMALDQLTAQVVSNCISAHIAVHGEIKEETIEVMQKVSDAMMGQAREIFKSGFYLSGMSRLQGMIRNPKLAPGIVLRALDLGFKVNGMIPKAPLIAIQSNTQNTYYEGMLREAKRIRLAKSNGNGNDNSSGS